MKILKYLIAVVALVGVIFFISGEKEIASLERPIPVNLSENLREDFRKLPFTGAHNFRDLGGYKTSDGKTVKWGKVYRSDNLHSLTDEDLKYMERLNLKSVVDYMYSTNKKNSFWEGSYFTTVNIVNEKLENITRELIYEQKENWN